MLPRREHVDPVIARAPGTDRVVSADIAARSVRKAQAAIREWGADGLAVILQRALVAGDRFAEAGLSAQRKAPKPPNAA